MMSFLNDVAPLLQLMLAIFSVVVTFVLLFFNVRAMRNAQRSVNELRLSREQENRPYVFFDFELEGNEMYMVLRNDGRTEALDISLSFEGDFKVWNALVGSNVYHFDDMAISTPLEFLAPGDAFREWMDFRPMFFRNNETRRMKGKLSYRDVQGDTHTIDLDINLEPYYRQSQLVRKDIGELIKVVKQIQRHIERAP
ncbi:MAG: hypothetical protein EP343_22045 [Deltaproteobacteria bacterium]|nr:MAG: hypothetical protein EP343_22045 [Deltaproteobacteria bacterium]